MKLTYTFLAIALTATHVLAHDHIGAGALDVNGNGQPDQGEPLALVSGSISGIKHLLPKPAGSRYGGYYSLDEQVRTLFPNDYFTLLALSDGQVLDEEIGHAKTGSYIWMAITAVVGPDGGHFGFWDENWAFTHTTPTKSFTTNQPTGNYKFVLSEPLSSPPDATEDPYGHIHNRGWTADIPGDYAVSFQLLDLSTNGTGGGPIHAPSEVYTVHFVAVPEPGTSVALLLGAAALLGNRRRWRRLATNSSMAKWTCGLVLAGCFLGQATASAHLTYPGTRDFGTFNGTDARSFTISSQATKAFGWADGTDADFARQDDQRYFRFTLQSAATITITVTAADAATLLPAFSLYAGLGHAVTNSANPDYDDAAVTQAYLATLGEPQPRKGAFDALHTFKIGNESNIPAGYVADLVTFVYIGNAADGTAQNYGPAAGINGDGLADGNITASFPLTAGDYTLVVGGANYTSEDTVARAFTATVSTIPEPSSTLLIAGGVAAIAVRRRRTACWVS